VRTTSGGAPPAQRERMRDGVRRPLRAAEKCASRRVHQRLRNKQNGRLRAQMRNKSIVSHLHACTAQDSDYSWGSCGGKRIHLPLEEHVHHSLTCVGQGALPSFTHAMLAALLITDRSRCVEQKDDEGPSTAHSWNPPEEAEIDATRGRTAETAANAAAIGTRAHGITGMQPRWSSAQHKRTIRWHMGGSAADTTASATGEGSATPATATAPRSRGRGARDIKARHRPESAYDSRKCTNNKPGPHKATV
jgi:hypothetical protein